jgi:hypothetical protein
MPPDIAAPLVERPKSYDDLLVRAAFREVLDRREHELRRVLSDYDFPKKVKCGLSGCRTLHLRGFLVETVDGLETLMGHVCGRKAFGDAVWDLASSQYRRDRERLDLLGRAEAIKAEAGAIEGRISRIFADRFGVRWIRDVRDAVRSLIGDGLCDALAVAQRRGELDITETQERSNAEIEKLAQLTSRPREHLRYVAHKLGRLSGLEWVTFKFSEKLRGELQSPLSDFVKLDHAAQPTPRLRKLVRQFDSWQKTLEDAEAAARTAVPFLNEENLRLLVLWIPKQKSGYREALSAWIGSPAHAELLAGRSV